ncbi:MAG: hypothetical protein MJ206_00330 [Bacilli bacterium]|nr:hypothetical protein [Bacilli bacterium]
MKRLQYCLVPLMAMSFLVNCGGGDKPTQTYTIRINETTNHFTPEQSTFTFKENVFDPIEVSYTTDEGYIVTKTKATIEKSYCDFNTDEKKLIIYPKVNQNFEINVSVTHLDQVHYIKIVDPLSSHLTIKKRTIPFRKDDFDEVYFPFEIDGYCSVKATPKSETGQCEVKVEDKKIVVTPKENANIDIETSVTEEYKTITFNVVEDGAKLGDEAKTTIIMPYGKTWGECVDKTKQVAIFGERDFKGWSFNNVVPNTGIIRNDYKIDESTNENVYAVFYHKIELTSKSTEIDQQIYSLDDHKMFLYLGLKNTGKYVVPQQQDFTIHDSSGIPITFSYFYSGGTITITFENYENIEQDIIYIFVRDKQPEFTFTSNLDEHLTCDCDGDVPIKKGENVIFTLTAINQTNDVVYIAPYEVDITIGGSPVSSKSYRIKDISKNQDRTKVEVMIFGSYVQGDVVVTAKADTTGGYRYKVLGYNVTIQGETSGTTTYTSSLNIKFDGSEIRTERIFIKIDNANWYACDALPSPYNQFISYDPNAKTITIAASDQNQIGSIEFHIFDGTYIVFAHENWDLIEELSSLPADYVNRLFQVGDYRPQGVKDFPYALRIVDMYHDNLANSNQKATLSIEFESLITEENEALVKHYSDRSDYACYKNGPLDCYLKTEFKETFPLSLQLAIKPVIKTVCCMDEDLPFDINYPIDVFAPSINELYEDGDFSDGSVYRYHKEHIGSVKKHPLGSTDNIDYWSRSCSHSPITATEGICVDDNGESQYTPAHFDKGILAAFCI